MTRLNPTQPEERALLSPCPACFAHVGEWCATQASRDSYVLRLHDRRTTGIWTVNLPSYRKPPLSQNVELHWAPARRLKDKLREETMWMAHAMHLPKGLRYVSVELHYRPATSRRRDEDNLAPTLKVCCDALVLYGLVPDDSHEYLTSASRIDANNSKLPGLYLLITDLSAVSGLIPSQEEMPAIKGDSCDNGLSGTANRSNDQPSLTTHPNQRKGQL